MRIRVAIADDQPLVRAGLVSMLRQTDDLDVVGEASNGNEAIALAERARPDVFLMDVRMPVLDGIAATAGITAVSGSTTRVIILTTFDLDEYVYAGLRAGASGFLLKDTAPEDLFHAIRVVAAGDALLAPAVTRRLIAEFAQRSPTTPTQSKALDQLTAREREVLVLVARGLSNSEIAQRIFVSTATAKTHVSRVLMKLNARDRAQLVALAYETGLIATGTDDIG